MSPMIDLLRLSRALHLTAEPLDTNGWMVSGGARSHLVRDGVCDCADAVYGRGECKHLLAIRLAVLDADVRGALQMMIPATGTRAVHR